MRKIATLVLVFFVFSACSVSEPSTTGSFADEEPKVKSPVEDTVDSPLESPVDNETDYTYQTVFRDIRGITSAEREIYEPMQRFEIENYEERNAVCADGTPAVYYFRPGEGDNAKNWIMFLEGGGGCLTEESCIETYQQKPYKFTSENLGPTLHNGGLLSKVPRINPDFYDYTHVHMPFCSLDMWVGDTQVEVAGQNLQLRGRVILDSVLEDLSDPSIVGDVHLGDAKSFLLTGSSAGGTGVYNNLDWMAERLAPLNVKGIIDAAWRLVIPKFDDGSVFSYEPVWDFFEPNLDETCLRDYADTPWDCMEIVKLAPYLETEHMFVVDVDDKGHFDNYGITMEDVNTPEGLAFIENRANLVRETVSVVEHVFAYSAFEHTSITGPRFFQIALNGLRLRDVIANFVFDSGPTYFIVSE